MHGWPKTRSSGMIWDASEPWYMSIVMIFVEYMTLLTKFTPGGALPSLHRVQLTALYLNSWGCHANATRVRWVFFTMYTDNINPLTSLLSILLMICFPMGFKWPHLHGLYQSMTLGTSPLPWLVKINLLPRPSIYYFKRCNLHIMIHRKYHLIHNTPWLLCHNYSVSWDFALTGSCV